MEDLVRITDLSKYFGKNQVLKNVNLSVHTGQILGLVGQSGSGKTTLIRLLLGIYNPDSGQIYLKGRKGTKLLRSRIGFASQEYSFYPRLTVEENLVFFGKMYNLQTSAIKTRMEELLQMVELTHAQKIRAEKLSGGMKRRLDVAIALINNPELLVLDEPTTGLDIVLKEKVWSLINAINKKGITVIVSSHDLEELERHCKNIVLIREGYVYSSRELQEYMKKHKLKRISSVFKALYQEK